MATGFYLIDNPPARAQYRSSRRAAPTGCIVLHTAESMLDLIGADSGAENVARFIAGRTDGAGSYHQIGDRDSIGRLVPFDHEAFHDGSGSNGWSIGLSLAMRASDWSNLSDQHADELIDTLVLMAREAAEWLDDVHDIKVPARRINKAESDAGMAGFISHGDRDPSRRTDPGKHFPWDIFIDRFAAHTGQEPTHMAEQHIRTWQQHLIDHQDADLGPAGAGGDFGPRTLERSIAHLDAERTAKLEAQERLATAGAELEETRRQLALARIRIQNVEAERDAAEAERDAANEQISDLLLGAEDDDTAQLIEIGRSTLNQWKRLQVLVGDDVA